MRGLPDTGHATHNHVEWAAVEEGFRLLERDLGKLQVYTCAEILPDSCKHQFYSNLSRSTP